MLFWRFFVYHSCHRGRNPLTLTSKIRLFFEKTTFFEKKSQMERKIVIFSERLFAVLVYSFYLWV